MSFFIVNNESGLITNIQVLPNAQPLILANENEQLHNVEISQAQHAMTIRAAGRIPYFINNAVVDGAE